MADRENVISCLEQCLDDSIAAVVPADTVRDAISLLKAQGPRVMTLDELQALQRQDVVWLEPEDVAAQWNRRANDG